MLCKRRLFAVAALSAFAALTGAQAQPAFVGRTLQFDNTSITSVGYDYPGDYGYRRGYHGEGPFGLLELPFALIGGVANLFTGGPGDTYNGSYSYRPYYASPYYGSPYADAYNGGSYYGSLYDGGSYHFGSRYDSGRYDGDRRIYEDRGYFSRRYDGDRRYSSGQYDDDYRNYGDHRYFSRRDDDDRRAYGDRKYFIGRYDGDYRYYGYRYYGDAYRARRYDDDPRYGDAYDRGRPAYDAGDDDD
jgi:hypothetical protein